MADIVNIYVDQGNIILDFGGDLDIQCCGSLSNEIRKELEALGVHMTFESVFCRLRTQERKEAKERQECIIPNDIKKESEKTEKGGYNERSD